MVAEVAEGEAERFARAVEKMRVRRAKRVPPMTDDKVLSGWNGLMIAALAQAGVMLGEDRYLESAQRAWRFINEQFWNGSRLANRWRKGELEESPQAVNYLAMAKAGRVLYQTTLQADYLTRGLEILDEALERFYDAGQGAFLMPKSGPISCCV